MLSAHERRDTDLFFREAVLKVVEVKKMEIVNIRRWSYEIGFKKFMEHPAFKELF